MFEHPPLTSLCERGLVFSCSKKKESRWLGGTQRLQEVRLVVVRFNDRNVG